MFLPKITILIAHFKEGPNAGHTLKFDGISHVLHTIPSGIFHPTALNLIGNGVVIDPEIFKGELDKLDGFNIDFAKKTLRFQKGTPLLPTHRFIDAASEAAKGKQRLDPPLKALVQPIWIKLEEMEYV